MASAMRKMAVYLGLVEDDHRFEDQYQDEYGDEYDEYGAELVQEDDRLDAHLADGPAVRRSRDLPVAGTVHATALARDTTFHPRPFNFAPSIGERLPLGTT